MAGIEPRTTRPETEPDDVPAPPWRTPRKNTAPRQPLGQDAIIDAGLRVLDRDGLDAFSMRRVAQALGTGAASLYAYVAGRDELLELMLDQAIGAVDVPPPDPARWQEQLKDHLRQARSAMTDHADIARVALARIPAGPNALRTSEGMLAILRAGGLPDQVAAWAVDRLYLYVNGDAYERSVFGQTGEVKQSPVEHASQVGEYFASLPAERFPHTVALADVLMTGAGDERFEFGLDLLVGGLAAYATPGA